MTNKQTDFNKYIKEQLKDDDFRSFYNEYGKHLEIAYKIVQLRKRANITQIQLAKKIGTTQSNIARMEKGQQNFTIGILNRLASVFGKSLKINFE